MLLENNYPMSTNATGMIIHTKADALHPYKTVYWHQL